MNAFKIMLSTLMLTTLLFGCKKDSLEIENGTYEGTFTVTYGSQQETGTTKLELKNGTYSCSGNPNRIPAGGSGTYTVDKGKITFVDTNVWTADFDWNLILNGSYDYTFVGNRLVLSADKNNVGNYKYDLEKQ